VPFYAHQIRSTSPFAGIESGVIKPRHGGGKSALEDVNVVGNHDEGVALTPALDRCINGVGKDRAWHALSLTGRKHRTTGLFMSVIGLWKSAE
jgi:hypothetical protein